MFFIPLRTDSPLRSTPYMNWALIAANALAFLATSLWPALTGRFELHPLHPTLVEFFTYQFLHAGPMHILGNMIFLYIFGNNVNDKMGNVGYLAFYLAGGIMAGICFTLTEQNGTPIIGASGAIAAVTGAYLILFPRSLVTVVYWFFYIGRVEIQSLWFILAFFAMDLFGNFAQQDGVAHTAHIGGTIFGSAVCLGLVVTRLLPRDQFDVWALIQRWNKRRQYRDLVSRGYNPFDYTQAMRDENRRADDPINQQVLELREKISGAMANKQIDAAAALYLQLVALDGTQVLSRQAQLDVAMQLYHQNQYAPAAAAFEKLLNSYPKQDRVEQIELTVGILYSRYLQQYGRAKQHLSKALDRMHDGREMQLAKEELEIVQAHLSPTNTGS